MEPSKRWGLKLQGFLLMIWLQMSLNLLALPPFDSVSLWSYSTPRTGRMTLHISMGGIQGVRSWHFSVTLCLSRSFESSVLGRKPPYQMGRGGQPPASLDPGAAWVWTLLRGLIYSYPAVLEIAQTQWVCSQGPSGLHHWDQKVPGSRNEFRPDNLKAESFTQIL